VLVFDRQIHINMVVLHRVYKFDIAL